MTRALVLSPEPVRARMAGMGIRALKIATHLARAGHDVLLAAPGGTEEGAAPGLSTADARALHFAAAARRCELAIVSGRPGFECLPPRFAGALVADLYDPFLVENLAYAETLGPWVFEEDRHALFALVGRADFVLAASEAQRLFYLGLLLGRGVLSPETLAGDSEARRLVEVVPFGVDDEPPGPARPHPSIGPGAHDVLFGGVYDWYDPGIVLKAWPAVLSSVPDARLLFTESPNPASTPQARLAAAAELASRRGWLGHSVHVVPWLAYGERGGLYRACRAAVLAHRPSLESALSFRTRLLDFLWAGLPVVATEGGAASELVARRGAGRVVPPEPEALAEALAQLLTSDAEHEECARRAREAAEEFRWSRTLEPLLVFAAAPVRRPRPSGAGLKAARGVLRRLGRPVPH